MPKTYWPFAFSAAIYLINRLPTPNLEFQSPYQKLFQKTPNYNRLRVFGCLCFPWLPPYTKHKMEDRSKPCVFLGYSTSQSDYLCLHKPTGRLCTSRHVTFQESRFPFSESPTSSSSPSEAHDMISVAPDHHPVTRVPVQTPAPPPASTTPCSDPHPQPHLDSPSPLQSQVSPSSSNSPSHSFSPINSEPTAPTENGPQPTAQTPNHTNTAQNPQQNIESSSPNIQTRAVETSEPEISPPSKSST